MAESVDGRQLYTATHGGMQGNAVLLIRNPGSGTTHIDFTPAEMIKLGEEMVRLGRDMQNSTT